MGRVLLAQIRYADSLGRGPGFQRLMLQDQQLYDVIKILASCIVDVEMEAITSNSRLRLASDNINPVTLDEFTFDAVDRLQHISAPFLSSLLKISAGVADLRIVWGKTPADLVTNPELSSEETSDDFRADSGYEDGVIALRDNMSHTMDVPRLGQGIATRNKNLVSIIACCVLSYSRSERTNLFQMMNGHFLFANHVPKRTIEFLYQMGLVVSNETIRRALQINARAILSMLDERIKNQQFFISYDNMNFYENVRDQRLYNKVHMVNYTAGYICFMNAPDGSLLLHIGCEQVQYDAVDNLIASDFLLDQVGYNHCTATTHYLLGRTLGKHFGQALKAQKHVIEGKLMPKYYNWPMPLKNIQCAIQKADVIPLPILPLDESKIATTVDIIRCLVERLGLAGVIEEKVVPIKGDFVTVKNITRAIYRKQDELNPFYKFSWVEPIASLFHLQINALRLFHITFWGRPSDKYSLQRFHAVLSRKGVTQKVKDFHACDEFFRTVIHAHVIALCMHHLGLIKIDDFQTWLSRNNWPELIRSIEQKFLGPEEVQNIRDYIGEEAFAKVARRLDIRKQGFKTEQEVARQSGTRFRKQTPKWDKIEREITEQVVLLSRNKTRENALLLLHEGLTYLEFVDACRGGFSGRVQKCLEYMAIIYQGSSTKNYAPETIHFVACFKRLWKEEFM